MNAKKVENDAGDQKKPVDLAVANGGPISKDQIAHRLRREQGRNGIPSNNRRAILMRFRNNVIVLFPFATMDDLSPLPHRMMQGANDVLVKLEAQTVLMNDGQGILIAFDLLLGMIERNAVFENEGFDSFVGGHDPFDRV